MVIHEFESQKLKGNVEHLELSPGPVEYFTVYSMPRDMRQATSFKEVFSSSQGEVQVIGQDYNNKFSLIAISIGNRFIGLEEMEYLADRLGVDVAPLVHRGKMDPELLHRQAKNVAIRHESGIYLWMKR